MRRRSSSPRSLVSRPRRARRPPGSTQLLVGGFKTRAFILVCLHAVFEPFDRLVLNRQPPGIVDSAFGIVTVLALQGQDAVLEARVVGAEALGEPWHSSIRERGTIAQPETDDEHETRREYVPSPISRPRTCLDGRAVAAIAPGMARSARTIRSDSFLERPLADRPTETSTRPSDSGERQVRGADGRAIAANDGEERPPPLPVSDFDQAPPNMPAIARTKPEPMVPLDWKS